MKIHIITTPRTGATAFGIQLSEYKKLPFINQPHNPIYINKKTKVGPVFYGGGISENIQSYVCHDIVNHYLMNFDFLNIPKDHKFIFIARKNKWQQLISYIVMNEVYNKQYNSRHNLNFSEIEITGKYSTVIKMFEYWTMFDLFTSRFTDIPIIYYEDIKFDDNLSIKKNTGYSNIKLINNAAIQNTYNKYMSKHTKNFSVDI